MRIRETSDEGAPVVASEPDGPHARIYRDIAAKVWARLEAERSISATPAIVFE
jgi:ATP-binding protein involved in chromosome partitioning